MEKPLVRLVSCNGIVKGTNIVNYTIENGVNMDSSEDFWFSEDGKEFEIEPTKICRSKWSVLINRFDPESLKDLIENLVVLGFGDYVFGNFIPSKKAMS